MIAAFKGHTNVVQELMQHGTSLDLQDTRGDTDLMYAAFNGRKDAANCLLSHGEAIDKRY